MVNQKSLATSQRQNLVLESIRKISGTSHSWVTVNDILVELQLQGYAVEVHNIRRDIKALLDIHPQLEINDNSGKGEKPKNGLAYGYRWAGEKMDITTGLSLPEALSLVMAERYLAQSFPALLTNSLHNIFVKAHNTLNLHKKSQITQWPEKFCFIQPSQPLIPPMIDHSILQTVHEALLSEKQIKVIYQANSQNNDKEKTYRLHPLGIIQRSPNTYLAAMANDYEDVYLYALHRMKSVECLEQQCRHKTDFDLHKYAMTQGHFGLGESITFKASICDHLAKILEETPLNHTQLITDSIKSGFKEINVTLPNTWQLRWWILGEGERIEVLEPIELRQQIAETIGKVFEYYCGYLKN